MKWLSQNAVALVGHVLTVVTLILGFWKITVQAKANFKTDQAIKMYDRSKEAIKNTLLHLEALRTTVWIIYVSYEDLKKVGVNDDIKAHMTELGRIQSELAAATMFLPPELEKELDGVYQSLTRLKSKMGLVELEDKKAVNQELIDLIEDWRVKSTRYMQEEYDKVRTHFNFA